MEEERWFKCLWWCHGCWCQNGQSDHFKNCWSHQFSTDNHLSLLWSTYREWTLKEKIYSEWQFPGWIMPVDATTRSKKKVQASGSWMRSVFPYRFLNAFFLLTRIYRCILYYSNKCWQHYFQNVFPFVWESRSSKMNDNRRSCQNCNYMEVNLDCNLTCKLYSVEVGFENV